MRRAELPVHRRSCPLPASFLLIGLRMVTRLCKSPGTPAGVGSFVVAFAGLCLAATTCRWNALAREAEFDVTPATTLMVPIRDRVGLATDVYLPAHDGKPLDRKLPAILIAAPPTAEPDRTDWGTDYAARGYAVIVQDTRGRYDSEGVWHMLSDDGPDGVDTANWIVTQPWSDGQIDVRHVLRGRTQHALAMSDCAHLKTVIPVDAMSNLGYASIRNGGAFELAIWNWIFWIGGPGGSRQARDLSTARAGPEGNDELPARLFAEPAVGAGTTPLKLIPEYEEWLVEADARRRQ